MCCYSEKNFSSLSYIIIDWYVELPNGLVHTFNKSESLFIKRFAGEKYHNIIGDLVLEK